MRHSAAALLIVVGGVAFVCAFPDAAPAIRFAPASIAFHLENNETTLRHVPATMAGGVAVFDYNQDGRPDIFLY